jgi:hypothetical protein
LFLESFDLLLDLLEIGLLRLQLLDAGVLVIQLALPGVVEIPQDQGAKQNAGANEEQRERRTGIDRPARGFRFGLSEKIYSDHG